MSTSSTDTAGWAERNKHNTKRLAVWTGAWLVTMAVAVFGPQLVWESNPTLTLLALAANLIVGAGMILANKTHLQGLDELQQRIQLEAMALALGVGLVVGLAYSTAGITNLIPFDAEISHVVMLLSVTYLVGIFIGRRKYQ
jgi:hypothetical protein